MFRPGAPRAATPAGDADRSGGGCVPPYREHREGQVVRHCDDGCSEGPRKGWGGSSTLLDVSLPPLPYAAPWDCDPKGGWPHAFHHALRVRNDPVERGTDACHRGTAFRGTKGQCGVEVDEPTQPPARRHPPMYAIATGEACSLAVWQEFRLVLPTCTRLQKSGITNLWEGIGERSV